MSSLSTLNPQPSTSNPDSSGLELTARGNLLPKKAMRLDDPSIDAVAASYPEAIRENLAWLAAWTRNECKGKLEILRERVKKAGFERSKLYFYQIFRGEYFSADDGEASDGQIENFNQIVDHLRKVYIVTQRAGKIPFVETGTYKRIADYITVCRMPDTVCKFGVIIGPTGAQKSASFDHYCELNNHGKCVRIEAPSTPSIHLFQVDLSNRYGARSSDRHARRVQIIRESVRNDRTIIIDNAQRLRRREYGHNQPIFHWLQKLQDDTGCAIILSFTPDEARFLTDAIAEDKLYFEQFEGRAGGRENFLVLDAYTPDADLIQFAIAFGFSKAEARSKEALKVFNYLARRPGRVRIFIHALQSAKRRLKDKEPLTLDHILALRSDLLKVDDEDPKATK